MRKVGIIKYGSTKVTRLILYGSLCVGVILTLILFVYDVSIVGYIRSRTLIGFILILYLLIALFLVKKDKMRTVSWMLIFLYTSVSFASLLYWGLNTAVGIFATSFVIILSGVLLGSRAILPVTLLVALILIVIQVIHSVGLVTPNISALMAQSSFFDVVSYITILGVFSLITWMSDSQIEKMLERAQKAETTLRSQKEILAIELERESVRLRNIQMKEIQHLYKFATVGQDAVATMHELSNHLSILNIDIDDIKQQNKNSTALANAQVGIEQINHMVREVRKKLDNSDKGKLFNGIAIIKRSVKDQQERFHQRKVLLNYKNSGGSVAHLKGDPFALMQIITILVNNALDACFNTENAMVRIQTKVLVSALEIYIEDNGPGISVSKQKSLFLPTKSTKQNGLGIGLYIAKHLTEVQFKGKISLVASKLQSGDSGTIFKIVLPIAKKPKV